MRNLNLLLPALCLLISCSQPTSESAVPRDPNQAVADTSASAGQPRENLWKNRGCELVTDEEMCKIFSVEPKRDVLNTRTLPNDAFCLRKWNKPDWKERETNNEKEGHSWLDPQNSLIIQIFGYTNNSHAKQHIDNLRRDRADTYEEQVSNLGDDALWSTSTVTLLVRKGHLVASITTNSTDNPHDNLARAIEVAKVALPKM